MGDPEEMGWCEVGASKWQATRAECEEIGGAWREDEPTVCVVATKAYGSAQDAHVLYLRRLKDRVVGGDQTAAQLWNDYWPSYMQMAMPVVALMGQDPMVRALVATLLVDPAIQTLRTMGTHLDPGSDDADVREKVREGVERLKENLSRLDLDGNGGSRLTETFLTSLREIEIETSKEAVDNESVIQP